MYCVLVKVQKNGIQQDVLIIFLKSLSVMLLSSSFNSLFTFISQMAKMALC